MQFQMLFGYKKNRRYLSTNWVRILAFSSIALSSKAHSSKVFSCSYFAALTLQRILTKEVLKLCVTNKDLEEADQKLLEFIAFIVCPLGSEQHRGNT